MRRGHVFVAAVLGALTMAPTAGDVGGCGRQATDLDPDRFVAARKLEDCDKCGQCGIETDHCKRACDPNLPSDVALPFTCRPLLHDGEVCLRALEAASCTTYATYVDDVAPSVPSECDFCHVPPPAVASPAFGDAAVDGASP